MDHSEKETALGPIPKSAATNYSIAGVSVGVIALGLVAIGNVLLWLILMPGSEPAGLSIGEICGAEAVLLFSCSLVLATLLPFIEAAFGGLDQVAIWHRRVAVAGVLLLVPHVALVSSFIDPYATTLGSGLGDLAAYGLLILSLWALAPRLRAAQWHGLINHLSRASYEKWLTGHRFTGLFVAAAVAHGAFVDPILHRSTPLLVIYLIIGGIGVAAYVYRELMARFVIPIYDYTVTGVQRLNDTTIQVALEPVRTPLSFVAGQFIFLAFGGPGAWQRHPFTVSSSPSQHKLEVSIKALGDYTRNLYDKLSPGIPAKIAGPFGMFDYRRGGHAQIWIAGGIGITPFMSWIRALDGNFDYDVDFYYSVAHKGDLLYRDEIEAAAKRYARLHPHFICSESDGKLTPEQVMQDQPERAALSVYMCGPPPMMDAFAKGLKKHGVPARQIRWEQFNIR